MSNFTNTKIKDTFQRVLQIDNGEIQDGLGLPVDARIQSIESDLGFTGDLDGTATLAVGLTSGDKIIQGNLDVIGKITAIEIYAQYESSSIIFSSGSTKFGNTFDDTHQFTGSVLITGSSFLYNRYNVITSNDTGSIVVNSASYAQTASYIQLSRVDGFTSYSSSVSSRVSSLENFSSSLDATFATDAQLNAATASLSSSIASLSSSYLNTSSSFSSGINVNSSSISALSSSFISFSASYNTGSFTGSFTGNLQGTSSWATNAQTASFAPNYVLTSATSSMLQPYVLTSQTSSMSVASASYVNISGVDGFVNYSSSVSTRIVNLENFSSSLDATFATDAQLNAYTASTNIRLNSLEIESGSIRSNFNTFTSSYNTDSSSFASRISTNTTNIANLSSATSSYVLNSQTGSFILVSQTSSMSVASASVATSASYALTASFATSGGTPGGANTTIQFNDTGTFSGSGNFTFNKTTNTVNLTGSLLVTGSTNTLGAVTVSGSVGINTTADAQSLLHIDGGASVNRVIMDANNNVARIFSFRTDNSQRWAFRVDDNETGANAGANFQLRRYADNGSFIDAPISLNRATGGITTIHPINASAGITGSLFGSSSFATTSSHALNAVSASFATQALSSSFASTASFAPNYVLTSVTSSMLAPYVLTSQTSSMSVASASVATSASYALTASFALNGGGTVNTGSLLTTASVNLNTITFTKGDGSTFPITVNTGSGGTTFPFTGSAIISGSLIVTGSANVQGAIGISRALIERAEITISASGTYTIYSAPTSSYRGIFADYTLVSTSPSGNARAGTIMSILSGSQVRYTETRTSDIGSTAGTTVQVNLSGGNLNLELNVVTVTTTWNLVSLVRTI